MKYQKYQTIPVPVHAVQFLKDEPWPPGVFKKGWNVGPGDNEADLPTVYIGSYGSSHTTWLRDGDWIVTYPSGLVQSMGDNEFKQRFEKKET